MKIAIVGLGQMGQAIKKISEAKGHTVVTIDPQNPEAQFKVIDSNSLTGVDVGIEFTAPSAVMENIEKFCNLKVPLVIGTTGWYNQIDIVKEKVSKSDSTIIYASNFSIGVNVFFKMVEKTAKIIDKFKDFDVSGIEVHHNKKVDSPSGTAITTGNILKDNIKRKKRLVFDKLDRKIEPDEIHFASLRAGFVPGSHEVIYDSPAETINLKVSARNREGYALGSVIAAEWVYNKKGFYNFEQVIDEMI